MERKCLQIREGSILVSVNDADYVQQQSCVRVANSHEAFDLLGRSPPYC